MTSVAFVAIARNEGERLKKCLQSLLKVSADIIYVDSGSTDGSQEFARSLGIEVLSLNTSQGFTMARARNAGWRKVMESYTETGFVHFIDGDCELAERWLPTALEFLNSHPDVAIVCGRRRERFAEESLYNRLIDIEWNTPVGETKSSGGDALMRLSVLEEVGGFNDALIAGEEPELCKRMRDKGWKIWRIENDMTWHDANMHTFFQWWKRLVRGGYGAADVALRCKMAGATGSDILFGSQVRSANLWVNTSIAFLVIATIGAVVTTCWWIILITLSLLVAIWIMQGLRIGISQAKRAESLVPALIYGMSLMLAKWPQWIGLLKYSTDLKAGRAAKLIEYKQ